MAETLCELVVALSLDSSNFSRNMRTINAQIQEAESTNITVNGGTIDITAQMSSFDYDGTATYNGGTIIINGQEVNSIPQSMMGGGGMGGRGGMGGQMGGQAPDAQNGNGFGGNGFAR